MKRNAEYFKKFISGLTVSVIFLLSAYLAFSQCGTYFKTKYRKILPGFSNFNVLDWTGDGRPDFWTFHLNPSTSTQEVRIYANTGSGDFNWDNPIVYTTAITEELPSYSVLDFESDGDKDLVSSRIVHRNNGNGTFTALTENFYPDEAGSPAFNTVGFIDVNADGILDWVKLNGVSGQGHSMNYRLGNANGTFAPRVDIITGTQIMNFFKVTGDFAGDDKVDIAYAYSGGKFRVLINNGSGTFTPGPENSSADMGALAVADVDNDGKDDFISSYLTSDSPRVRHMFIFKNNGDGTFSKTEIPVFQVVSNASGANSTELRTGDFNGDGFVDIIEFGNSSYIGNNFYSVFLNNGSGGFTRADYRKTYYQSSSNDILFADFNGDNKTDFYLRYNYSQHYANIFGEQVVLIQYNQCQAFGGTKFANFDADEAPDLTIWNPNTGDWGSRSVRWLSFAPLGSKFFNWGLGSHGDVPAPGDFDGDGRTDYSVYRNSTGFWYINLSSNSSWYVFKFGLPGDIPIPNDYDGGGKTDIAVFRPSDGNWYIWYSETQQFSAVHFGADGDKPVPADYDGDGKTDVGVFRPSEGNWYYLKSSDGNYGIVHWGISTDKPVPADYDGDGRADITVWRDGDWYILRSSNLSFVFFHWGSAGDVPLPNYDNGETAVPMVFRPATWNWHSSRPGVLGAVFFGGTNYVPVYFGLPNN